jgi:hypothetical protein
VVETQDPSFRLEATGDLVVVDFRKLKSSPALKARATQLAR